MASDAVVFAEKRKVTAVSLNQVEIAKLRGGVPLLVISIENGNFVDTQNSDLREDPVFW